MKAESKKTTAPLSVQQARAADETSSVAAATEGQSPGPLDDEGAALAKVRDLLFGEQAREADKRLRELERSFTETINRLNREASERVENLGRDLHAKLDRLASEVATKEAALQENNEKTSQRIEAVRVELTDRMTDDANALYERTTENHEKAIAYVDEVARTLDVAKTDRETLSGLFSEMASRVSGN